MTDEDATAPAYLLPTLNSPGSPTTWLLPPAPERRVGAIMAKLGANVTAHDLSDGRLLWFLPDAAPPANPIAALLACRAPHRPAQSLRGTALVTGGTPNWPAGHTAYQSTLTRAELDAAELLLKQRAARRAAASALQSVARETGRSLDDVRGLLRALCGCESDRATAAQIDTVRSTLLRT